MCDGELDRSVVRPVNFIDELKALNIPYEFDVISNAKHTQQVTNPYRTDCVNMYVTFLEKY